MADTMLKATLSENELKISIGQCLRIFMLSVLWLPNVPLWAKLLIVYAADYIDGARFAGIHTHLLDYQLRDKILDAITYTAVAIYMLTTVPRQSAPQLIWLLVPLLLFRVIGVARLAYTGNASSMLMYPDFFREFSLVMAAMADGVLPGRASFTANAAWLAGVVTFKVVYEYFHHVNRARLISLLKTM